MIHKHFLLTVKLNDPPTSVADATSFLSELVEKINMKVFFEPFGKFCDDPANYGVTAIVGLTTSHCALHCWNGDGYEAFCNIDIYSCKDFDETVVIALIEDYWGIKTIDAMHIIRRDPK